MEKNCCKSMDNFVKQSFLPDGNIDYDNCDIVINKWNNGIYGIPIHDGGTSMIVIEYCPWCGKKLALPGDIESGERYIDVNG